MSVSKEPAKRARLRRLFSRGPIVGVAAGAMLITAGIQLPAAAAVPQPQQAVSQSVASVIQCAVGQAPVARHNTNVYQVQNQWGGPNAPWHPGGNFTLGARSHQHVVRLDINSSNGGRTLTGTMTYQGEGPIGFRGFLVRPNTYAVQNQWGGPRAPWHRGGLWVIGSRTNQNVVAMNVSSPDRGAHLYGTMTYAGEGPIGFRGTRI